MVLVLFAYAYKIWVLLPIGLHWLMMLIWLIYLNTDFHGKSNGQIVERFFQAVMAFLHIFLFFNLSEGRSRENVTKFYILIFVEDAILLGLWYPRRKSTVSYNDILLTLIIVGFVMALVFMISYYMIWHPNVKIQKQPDRPADVALDVSNTAEATEYPTLRRKMNKSFGFDADDILTHQMATAKLLTRSGLQRSAAQQSTRSTDSRGSSINWNRPTQESLTNYNKKSKTKYHTITRDQLTNSTQLLQPAGKSLVL